MIEWHISQDLVPYEEAIQIMEDRVKHIIKGAKSEMVWCLEHPPLYTAGTSAQEKDLLHRHNLPVYQTGRGGQYTYHGPGQRVVYVMVDLTKRGRDVHAFVTALEQWIINTLSIFDIQGERRSGRVGIWVNHEKKDQKIAALGIRLRRWISFHGVAINVHPHLDFFQGIVPCGISQYGVTSCEALGKKISLRDLDKILQEQWEKVPLLKGIQKA